jgi:L-lactate dehydrogenase complex protein LldE
LRDEAPPTRGARVQAERGDMADVRAYQRGEQVALFVPCFVDVFAPQAAIATVTLLERLGVRVSYPSDQTCCGQPAHNAGFNPQARALADRFARTFAGFDWIVTMSGSCAAMARAGFSEAGASDSAVAIGAKVFDLALFLTDALRLTDVGARFPHAVTYHEGCHARRILASGDAPLRLLRAVRDITLVELPASEECCGFGGGFSVEFDRISASMGEAKCANALSTGAQYLVSGDPSCLLHLDGLVRKSGAALETMHLAQVLAAT